MYGQREPAISLEWGWKSEDGLSVSLKVAIGAARGLAYQHSSSAVEIPIVHTEFKATNILLGSSHEANISDFVLVKLMPESQETCVTATVLGTYGYSDPEYTLVIHIPNDMKKLKKVINQEMEQGSYMMESIAMFVNLVPRCVRLDGRELPSMSECVEELRIVRYADSNGLGMAVHTRRMI